MSSVRGVQLFTGISLKQRVVSGAKWTTFSAGATTLLQFVQTAVLAQLLSLEDFGMIAMLTVVVGFAQSFSDFGISNAIMHRQDVNSGQLSSLYWLNFLAGAVVFSILFTASPLVAMFYREPRLTELMQWSILVFLIAPIGQQFQILLQKDLRFKALAGCEVTARLVGLGVAGVTAWAGSGVFAFIWAALAASGALSLTLLMAGSSLHRPSLHFRFAETKSFLGFGAYQMGERSINYFNINFDKVIIGRFLGPDVLGLYSLAWSLAVQPISRISPILTRIALPVFARIQNQPEALKSGFFKVLGIVSTMNFPLLFGLAAVAPVFIPVVFGDQWLPSVLLVQILAMVSLLRSVANPIGSLLVAKGRADLGFKWNLLLFFSQSLGIVVGAILGGVHAVAVAVLLLQATYFFLSYHFLVSTLLGPSWKSYLSSILPAFWMSSTMGLVVWAIVSALHQTQLDPRIVLAISVSAGACYLGVIAFTLRRKELFDFFRAYVHSRPQHT